MGGSIIEVVVSICGFVVNGNGYSVVKLEIETKRSWNDIENSLISKV